MSVNQIPGDGNQYCKRQRINTKSFFSYLRDVLTPLVSFVFKHINNIPLL